MLGSAEYDELTDRNSGDGHEVELAAITQESGQWYAQQEIEDAIRTDRFCCTDLECGESTDVYRGSSQVNVRPIEPRRTVAW